MKMAEKTKTSSHKLYSFDIFDTLITRKVAEPKGIFLIMQHAINTDERFSGLPAFLKDNFPVLRTEAEEYLRTLVDNVEEQEITFADIYRIISFSNALSPEEEKMLRDLEIETEIKNLVPVRENINKLKDKIQQGFKVILISDMYFSSDDLHRILSHFDPVFNDIKIYVSSETKKCKHRGDMYNYVRDTENNSFSDWFHYGDNKAADVKRARKKNINALYYEYVRLHKCEKRALKSYNDPYVQLSCGTSKNCRLFYNGDKVFNFAATIGAPAFFSYVAWVLDQSLRRNIKHLYFVARDGYILKMIADVIIGHCGYDIKTHYIYGSRDAWRLPSMINADSDFSLMFNCLIIKNIAEIANTFHIEKDELLKFLPEKYKKYKSNISVKVKEEIGQILFSNDEFRKYILEISKKERELLTGYLKQEIDFSADDFAFVEFNGTGRTMDSLNDVINTFHKCRIKTFYMFLSLCDVNKNSAKLAYFPNNNFCHHSFECLLRAPHGQTTGYEERNSVFYPVFDDSEVDSMKKWGIDSYADGVKAYTKEYVKALTENNLPLCNLSVYMSVYDYMMHKPDKETADIFGSVPFSSGLKNKNVQESSPKIKLSDAILMLIWGVRMETVNRKVTNARSSKLMYLVFAVSKLISNIRRFIFDFGFSKEKKYAFVRIMGFRFGKYNK